MTTLQNLSLDPTRPVPLYAQLAEQLRERIARGELTTGAALPPVRTLAEALGCTPGTVARGYALLQEDGLLVARRGGGTHVADPQPRQQAWLREGRLVNAFERSLLDAIGQGYSLAEIEAAFGLALGRWRTALTQATPIGEPASLTTFTFAGSHDLAMETLLRLAQRPPQSVQPEIRYIGSLSGLMALAHGQADVAGIHLLDETGEYNIPFVRRILVGQRAVVVHLATRLLGWVVAPGNPLGLNSWDDLAQPGLRIINRQRGSGTRILIDQQLTRLGMTPSQLQGYDQTVDTHLAVAQAVAEKKADAGIGLLAAARACELDFNPLLEEPYDLVIPEDRYVLPAVQALLGVMRTPDFQEIVAALGGYRLDGCGDETWL